MAGSPRRVSSLHGNKLVSDQVAPDVAIAHLAGQEWGVLSVEELRRCGLSRKAILGRTRSGRPRCIHRGVYAVGHANLPLKAAS
jgi:hypothetical protein